LNRYYANGAANLIGRRTYFRKLSIADNSGLTLFHYHEQLHMDYGFVTLFYHITITPSASTTRLRLGLMAAAPDGTRAMASRR
jgi:hypothetical protein